MARANKRGRKSANARKQVRTSNPFPPGTGAQAISGKELSHKGSSKPDTPPELEGPRGQGALPKVARSFEAGQARAKAKQDMLESGEVEEGDE